MGTIDGGVAGSVHDKKQVNWLVLTAAMCAGLMGLTAFSAFGQHVPAGPQPSGRSIGGFLTADGRFDLDAARRSGYEGPLEIEGVESRIDPATRELNFQASFPASLADHPDDIYWDPTISPCVPGVDGSVCALTVYDGKLIAGGYFARAGGVGANRVASWDGSSWSPLGSGMDNYVYALTVYDGKLIAGGQFTIAGSKTSAYLAEWTKCCNGIRGNVDFDEEDRITIADITYLIAAVFRGGPAPLCLEEADVVADGKLKISDLTYLIAHVFRGGPAPAACP